MATGAVISACVWVISPAQALGFTSLFSFPGGNGGGVPQAGLIADSGGSLYGTTFGGGNTACGALGCGTIFKVSFVGGVPRHTVLHRFTGGAGGYGPNTQLIFGKDGALYGMTLNGGGCTKSPTTGCGTLFRLKRSPTGWVFTTLYKFKGGADGYSPRGALVKDANGNIYGATYYGGRVISGQCNLGCGLVFRFKPPALTANGVVPGVIYRFDHKKGKNPTGLQFVDGKIYGTAFAGGTLNRGTVFTLSPPAANDPAASVADAIDEPQADPVQWAVKVIFNFLGGRNGYQPNDLVVDGLKNIWVTLLCSDGAAVVKVATAPTIKTTIVRPPTSDQQRTGGMAINLLNFNRLVATSMLLTTTGAAAPNGAGKGTVLRLGLGSSGARTSETLVKGFSGGADGRVPVGRMIEVIKGSAREYYGVTSSGGANGGGTIYRVK
jgi:uncharacterized repeat protein (TIGR03803 family)